MSEDMSSSTGRSPTEAARAGFNQARESAKQAMGVVRERASEYYDQGKAKAADVQEKVEGMVREQPMKAVLIAAGAGLLLGMLLKRR